MVPDVAFVERFRADLDALSDPSARLGIAVSGGPDSLALLLLAAAARPGRIEAATVDHGLRRGGRDEAEMVADLCARLHVEHAILAIEWDLPPVSAIQEQARTVRYGALGAWLDERGLAALLTAHHLDDQAETIAMRLNRGSGVRGLAGMRRNAPLPGGTDHVLLRPLLGWRRSDLDEICAAAGVTPAFDPSNDDANFERVRVRRGLAGADWLEPKGFARSAEHLAAADEALGWVAEREWLESVDAGPSEIVYRASPAPVEIRRRIVSRAVAMTATEGAADDLRGRELDRLMADLEAGRTSTLRGVRCSGGLDWSFTPAKARRPDKPG